jgi:hypothetical protein
MLLAWCLNEERAAKERVGQAIYRTELVPGVPLEVSVTAEMAEQAQYAVDAITDLRSDARFAWYEHELNLSRWIPEGHGTADVILYDPTSGALRIIDAKFGTGYRVPAAGYDFLGNRQLLLYALGALDELEGLLDLVAIELIVVQPPLDHIDIYELSVESLLEFGERLRQATTLALSFPPPAYPGELQCRWCPARATCVPLEAHIRETLVGDFDLDMAPETVVADLDSEHLSTRMQALELLKIWGAALEQEAFARLVAGGVVPGWKLVEGRTQRRWVDYDKALTVLSRLFGKKQVTESKLLGIPAAQKLAGKERWPKLEEKLVVRPAGKPTLVRDADPRPVWNGKVSAEDFDNGNDSKE